MRATMAGLLLFVGGVAASLLGSWLIHRVPTTGAAWWHDAAGVWSIIVMIAGIITAGLGLALAVTGGL